MNNSARHSSELRIQLTFGSVFFAALHIIEREKIQIKKMGTEGGGGGGGGGDGAV